MKDTMKEMLLLVRAYCKAERVLLNFQIRSAMRKAIFIYLTVAFGFISYVLFNVAGYLALVDEWGSLYSILILAVTNFMVTIILLTRVFAVPKKNEKEHLALELRQLSCEQLQKKIDNVSNNIDNFEAIFHGLMPLLKNISAIGSILGLVFALLKPFLRTKKSKA